MIYRGANVNEPIKTKGGDMVMLLHYAVSKSDVRCIRVLANLGANFNARDSWNRTPLHWAAACGVGPDVVEVLINEGAIMDARDANEFTPLHYCAKKNNDQIESVQKLIARGASLEAVGGMGETVLHVAVSNRNLEMVKLLLSHRVNINAMDDFGCTPLLVSIIMNKVEQETEIVSI